MRSILIKDTTRDERDQIVRESLGFSEVSCEEPDGYDFYLPYIEGEMELKDLNMAYQAGYVMADLDHDRRSSSCTM